MLFLVLGRGKTGRIIANVAHEHGHGVRVLGEEENRNAMALTAPFLAGFDAVIDFTTPEAAVSNMRACLANGARMVVGTITWTICARWRRAGSLVFSTEPISRSACRLSIGWRANWLSLFLHIAS